MDGHLTILQKACCEAVWRAATQRGQHGAPLYVDPDVPAAKLQLARLVQGLPQDIMAAITMREVSQYGRLTGGYSGRWDSTALQADALTPPRAGSSSPTSCTSPGAEAAQDGAQAAR